MRHGPGSIPMMDVVRALAGQPVIWIIDSVEPSDPGQVRLLRRFGPVVDVSARTTASLAAELGPSCPAGMVTFFDTGMVQLAELAQLLGLPFHSPPTASALVDKERQRTVLAAGGVPGPRTWVIDSKDADAWARLQHDVTWPAVLKPCCGAGSRDVTLVVGADDVQRAVEADPAQRFVLEEYLADGPGLPMAGAAGFVSVESVISAGTTTHVAVTGRFALAEPFRETGSFVPAVLPEGAQGPLLAMVDQAIDALGIVHGCLHTEVKFTPDGPRIIEVNGRLGGAVPGMVRRATGIDLLAVALRVARNEQPGVAALAPTHGVAYHFFVQPPKVVAELTGIAGLDEVAALPGVEEVQAMKSIGDVVDHRIGTRCVIAEVAGTVSDHHELALLDEDVRRRIRATFA